MVEKGYTRVNEVDLGQRDVMGLTRGICGVYVDKQGRTRMTRGIRG